MPPPQPRNGRSTGQTKGYKNAFYFFAITFVISLILAGPTQTTMGEVELTIAIITLAVVLAIALIGDILGAAVIAAEEAPFHSMASNRVPGAKEAVMLVRQSARVASIFSDVIGDVCGTVSGAIGAAMALNIMMIFPGIPATIVSVVTLSLIASITVGAKAWTKGFAVRNAKNIVGTAGKILFLLKQLSPKRLVRS